MFFEKEKKTKTNNNNPGRLLNLSANPSFSHQARFHSGIPHYERRDEVSKK